MTVNITVAALLHIIIWGKGKHDYRRFLKGQESISRSWTLRVQLLPLREEGTSAIVLSAIAGRTFTEPLVSSDDTIQHAVGRTSLIVFSRGERSA